MLRTSGRRALSTGNRPSVSRAAWPTTSKTFFRLLLLTSASNGGAAGNSWSSAWLTRWFMAPARLAATGGLGSKPGQSETNRSDGSRSWTVSRDPGIKGSSP